MRHKLKVTLGPQQPAVFPSTRAYRFVSDALVMAGYNGNMAWSEVLAGVRAVREALSIHLAENVMKRQGIDDTAHNHRLGNRGGAAVIGPPVRFIQSIKTSRTGTDKHGNQIEEAIEQVHDGYPQPDLEQVVEEVAPRMEKLLDSPPDEDGDKLVEDISSAEEFKKVPHALPDPKEPDDNDLKKLVDEYGEI